VTAGEGSPKVARGARPPARDLAVVAAAFAAALGLFWIAQWRVAGAAGWSSFPLDDSWIHLQFARNLAEGRGFAYNPGVPVGGSTAPLWTLLLAGAYALGGSHPFWAKLIGVAATLVTALLARHLAWRWTADRAVALLVGVVTAVAGPAVWGALSGMEVSLAALLVTAAIACHAAGRDAATAALLGLSVLARPETLVLVPLVWLARPITWRRTAIFFAATAVCVVPWAVFNLVTVGTPLPATASAKVDGGLIGFLSGTRESVAAAVLVRPWRFVEEWVSWLGLVDVLLPLLVPVGLAVLWYRGDRRVGLPALALLLHPIGMALLAPYRGPGFQEGRYSIHLLPLAIVVAGIGLGVVPRRRRLRAVAMALFLAAAVAAVGPAAARYAWAVQNIDAMQVRLGEWIATRTPPAARLALNDAGAIAYVSRREVLDLMGLVTPAIIPYRRHGEAGILEYLGRACPDYLIIFPAWFPALAAMSDRFTPIHRIRLDHNTVAGADEMVVYETAWNRWRQPAAPCPEGEIDNVRLRR
jgi:arabinofuranosyltransferase